MLVMYMLHGSTTTAIQTSKHTVITVYDLLSMYPLLTGQCN